MNLLQVKNLNVGYSTVEGTVKAIDGINLDVTEGEILGLVGESGCGKTTLALSTLKLIPEATISGEILYAGKDLIRKSENEMREIRGKEIGLIFQDPTSSLNPVLTSGFQVSEAVTSHHKLHSEDAKKRVIDLLYRVGLPDPERAFSAFPHELSGGMRQRVMIAMAISCNPKLLFADEPTTNLDVSVEAQILKLISQLSLESNCSVVLITHNLGIVAQYAHRVAVMYAGDIVEVGDVLTIFENPEHPYTRGLLRSVPRVDIKLPKLCEIPGQVPNLLDPPSGCKFRARCEYMTKRCAEKPLLKKVGANHVVACHEAKT